MTGRNTNHYTTSDRGKMKEKKHFITKNRFKRVGGLRKNSLPQSRLASEPNDSELSVCKNFTDERVCT